MHLEQYTGKADSLGQFNFILNLKQKGEQKTCLDKNHSTFNAFVVRLVDEVNKDDHNVDLRYKSI